MILWQYFDSFLEYLTTIRLKSIANDYLYRPMSGSRLQPGDRGIGTKWHLEKVSGKTYRLRSFKGDYLTRTNFDEEGKRIEMTSKAMQEKEREWTMMKRGNKVELISWKGDSLHRALHKTLVTTWNTGEGNEWSLEKIVSGEISLRLKQKLVADPEVLLGVGALTKGGPANVTARKFPRMGAVSVVSCCIGSTSGLVYSLPPQICYWKTKIFQRQNSCPISHLHRLPVLICICILFSQYGKKWLLKLTF